MELNLDYLSFTKSKINTKGLIGFTTFKIGNDYSYYQLPTYLIRMPVGNKLVRLLYPEKQPPPNRDMQETIDLELSAYIKVNYSEVMK